MPSLGKVSKGKGARHVRATAAAEAVVSGLGFTRVSINIFGRHESNVLHSYLPPVDLTADSILHAIAAWHALQCEIASYLAVMARAAGDD